jgi:hypothetical protein
VRAQPRRSRRTARRRAAPLAHPARLRGSRRAAPLFLVGLLLAAPGVARADEAGSVTATGGPVRATLSWQAAELGVADPRLVVERDGVQAFAASPFRAGSACAEGGCSLLASGRRDSPLQVIDLDADGDPEVLVDAFTGGAHCCATTEVFRRDPTGAYAAVGLRWGNAGYEVRDLDSDGRPELVTADDTFAAAFTAYAASYSPVRIVRFDARRRSGLVALTRRFAARVRSDLARIRRLIRSQRRRADADLRGLVAAEIADLYLLGRPRTAVRTLDAHVRRGDANGGTAGPASRGRAFRRDLLRFLKRNGYR